MFCEKRENLIHIYSRLRLLGADDAAELIRQLPELESKVREPVLFEKSLPTDYEIKAAMYHSDKDQN